MSRILRRPMFRGGPASSDGVGITSGLNNPRQGYQKAGSVQKNDDVDFDWLRDTGLGNVLNKGIYEYSIKEPLAAIYNLAGVPLNKISEFTTGYNPGFSGERFFNLDMKNRTPDTAAFFGMDTGAKQGMTYKNEKIKEYEDKIKAEKEAAEKAKLFSPGSNEGEVVTKRNALSTLGQDIDTYTKLLMENAGPDKDEYTRQKYLTLAKFGLNLLKPTPVGIKPSLATSIASAAEKPLEEYGNISMQQSKEDRALRQAAVQLGIQKHMPGNIAKGIQDLMAMNPNMTAQEATSIYTTGKNSAAIAKEKFNEVIQRQKDIEDLATKDPALKKLSKIDPTFSNTYAQIATEQGLYGHELKGLASDYNVYQPGSIYYAPDKQTGQLLPHKFIKGKFYSIREPEFKQKGI